MLPRRATIGLCLPKWRQWNGNLLVFRVRVATTYYNILAKELRSIWLQAMSERWSSIEIKLPLGLVGCGVIIILNSGKNGCPWWWQVRKLWLSDWSGYLDYGGARGVWSMATIALGRVIDSFLPFVSILFFFLLLIFFIWFAWLLIVFVMRLVPIWAFDLVMVGTGLDYSGVCISDGLVMWAVIEAWFYMVMVISMMVEDGSGIGSLNCYLGLFSVWNYCACLASSQDSTFHW